MGYIRFHCCFLLLLLFNGAAFAQRLEAQSVRFERLSIEQGLSQGTVLGIVQDKQGFIWIATYDGLNRYDGYQFKYYRHDEDNPKSLSGSSVSAIFIDSSDTLWVGTDETGLNRYDRTSDTFEHLAFDPKDPQSLSENFIAGISEDNKGRLWVATRNQGVNLYDSQTNRFIRFKHQADDPASLSQNQINKIHADRQGRIWMTTDNGGLNRYDSKSGGFIHYRHNPDDPLSLSSDKLYNLYADNKGYLWVGSDKGLNRLDIATSEVTRFRFNKDDPSSINHDLVWTITGDHHGEIWAGTDGGIAKFDSQSERFSRLVHSNTDSHSLAHNAVLSSFTDREGILWFGTAGGGVNKLDLTTLRFGHFKHQGPNSLSGNLVMSFYQQPNGDLWIGADGSGLNRYSDKTGEYQHFRHDVEDDTAIGSDRIWSIQPAQQGKLWLGTFGHGIELFDPDKGVLKRYRYDKEDPNSLPGNWLYDLFVDSKGTLWIGTGEGGLGRYNPKTDDFSRWLHDSQNPNSLTSNMVFDIFEDSKGRYWVATEGGISRFDGQSNHFVRYTKDTQKNHSLSRNFVVSIAEDNQGTLWFGTVGGGFSRYNESSDDFTTYGLKQGLPNEIVYGILVDDSGELWLSTNKGLSKFNPKTERFVNFDVQDGLQSNEFNGNAYLKGLGGELFFGGVNGFNRFLPKRIIDTPANIAVTFTDFSVLNRPVAIATKPHSAENETAYRIPAAINVLDEIHLYHNQNLVSFEFSALSFRAPEKLRYQYQLEGFDQQWVNVDARFRRATYTNLPAGNYTLRVRAGKAAQWSNNTGELSIRVSPAPWLSRWALAGYAIILLLLVFGFIQYRVNSSKMRNELKYLERLKQLDKLKDAFLANTSHELRTPLNGIIGLSESLLDGSAGRLPPKASQDLATVVTSGKRLANLVNDILDLSKLKEHSIVLNRQPLSLCHIADSVLSLSKPIAKDKGLTLINDIAPDLPCVDADENRLVQILHNLVGNAVKFTQSGSVTLSAYRNYDEVIIAVSDTGIGIEQSQIERIFESFEQVANDDTRLHGGTGLGLSITRQLLALHGASIEVDSTPNQGSSFSFKLPVSDGTAVNSVALAQSMVLESIDEQSIEVSEQVEGERFKLLVVDDEPINRQVFKHHLQAHHYHVVEAVDGQTALTLLHNQGPFDMVLLDVMMPNMSGIEVCRQIRQKWSVSELPVVFLTAKNQLQDIVEGFEVGGNDHISKPVTKQELLSRVATHLRLLEVNRNLDSIVAQRTEQIKSTQKQLLLSEKLAALGTLMAGVAHEINNPTNFVNVSVQNLEADLKKCKEFIFELAEDADEEIINSFAQYFDPLEQHIATIKDGTERIKCIVKDLKSATHLEESEKQVVDIGDIVTSTMNLFATQHKNQIQLVKQIAPCPPIACYPSKLNQVLMNLLVNASDAILEQPDYQGDGVITVNCKTQQSIVVISVSDNGPGMAQQTIEHLFEPFFTTKDIDHGTGLGLSISYDIIQKHQGEIVVTSSLGEGTTFLVKLPLQPTN